VGNKISAHSYGWMEEKAFPSSSDIFITMKNFFLAWKMHLPVLISGINFLEIAFELPISNDTKYPLLWQQTLILKATVLISSNISCALKVYPRF
jgi:hypothetical protein